MLPLKPIIVAIVAVAAATLVSAQTYRPAGRVVLGAPDRWDYTVFDAASGRVYVAHGDRVTVVDGRSGKIVGEVAGIPGGSHGIAVSAATGQGFTDDGAAGTAIAFDLKTLTVLHRIPARDDADAVVADARSGHIFVIEGDPAAITVIDPKADKAIATIAVGEALEYAVSDDAGGLYVAGKAKGDVVKIDTATNKVVAHWPAADCRAPHGLAMDRKRSRLFVGCVNSEMIVLDARNGRLIATLAIGKGNDAVAFDPVRHRLFSANGVDGTISVYQEDGDGYRALDPIPTRPSGRTMALDPTSGRLFVPAADLEPNPAPGAKAKAKPGSLQLLMFDPID